MTDAESLARWMYKIMVDKFHPDSEKRWEGLSKDEKERILYVAKRLTYHPPSMIRKACKETETHA